MTFRTLTTIILCTVSLSALAVPTAFAGPNEHANGHAQGNGGSNGNGGGGGGGGNDNGGGPTISPGPHSVVRQYVIANGLKQGELARTLKSWNSLNANPKAFINNLDNPNSLLGKEARYICANAATDTALTTFTDLGGNPQSPPTEQAAADAQAYLDALMLLDGADPNTVATDPNSTTEEVAAANLVLGSDLTETTAQAIVDQYDAWVAYQKAQQEATDSFAAASVSYRKSTDLSALKAKVDDIIAQQGLDTSLCDTSVASTK